MSRKKEPTDGELLRMLAERHGWTFAPGSTTSFAIAVDPHTRVRIDLKVTPILEPSLVRDLEQRAVDMIADLDRGSWNDTCSHDVVRHSAGYQSSKRNRRARACKLHVVGVVISTERRWNDETKALEPSHRFSFRCYRHLVHEVDEASVIHRVDLAHRFLVARVEREKGIEQRAMFRRKSPEQHIADDMRAAGKHAEADELTRQTPRHSYRCNKLRMDVGARYPMGDPNIECTCDHAARLAEFRSNRSPSAPTPTTSQEVP